MIFIFFVFLCLGSSRALDCYVCEYIEDYQNPHECQESPEDSCLMSIDDILIPGGFRGAIKSSGRSVSYGVASSGQSTVERQPRGYYPYTYCVKYTGKEASTGKETVYRGGMGFKNNGGIENGCQDYLPDGVHLPGVSEIEICFCDEDGCNGANSLVKMSAIPILISLVFYLYNLF